MVDYLEAVPFWKLYQIDEAYIDLVVESVFVPCKNTYKLFHALDLQDPNSLQELFGKSLVLDFLW